MDAYFVSNPETGVGLHLCRDCTVKGVDPDMRVEELKLNEEDRTDVALCCELCGGVILEPAS